MPDWDIRDRLVLITGATSGIGLAAAQALHARGARLVIVARSERRADDAVEQIRSAGDGDASIEVVLADLSSQADVRRLAGEVLGRHRRLDVLVNNAGAVYGSRALTADGLEMTWAVNHLAPFLLTARLLDRLQESAPARIVTTASDAHEGARAIPFDDLDGARAFGRRGPARYLGGQRRYGETKLANILFTRELARRLAGRGVTANCFNPGLVATGWNRNNGRLMSAAMAVARPFSRSPERGAETLVWLVCAPEVADESGGYFVDRRRTDPSRAAQDAEAAARLWEVSEQQTRERAAPAGA